MQRQRGPPPCALSRTFLGQEWQGLLAAVQVSQPSVGVPVDLAGWTLHLDGRQVSRDSQLFWGGQDFSRAVCRAQWWYVGGRFSLRLLIQFFLLVLSLSLCFCLCLSVSSLSPPLPGSLTSPPSLGFLSVSVSLSLVSFAGYVCLPSFFFACLQSTKTKQKKPTTTTNKQTKPDTERHNLQYMHRNNDSGNLFKQSTPVTACASNADPVKKTIEGVVISQRER